MNKLIFSITLTVPLLTSSALQGGEHGKGLIDCGSKNEVCADEKMTHVPSPVWQDQIIYALMIDQFNDGDRERNNDGYDLYRPKEEGYYSGGDLAGIEEKIGYLKRLGVTTLLISPPVANQWWNNGLQSTGYHGYWPVNFREVDAHYGSLQDYKRLVSTLHSNNMYLIQDVVLNHVAPYYGYLNDEYDPNDKSKYFDLDRSSIPQKPTQPPFDKIDLLNPEDAKAAIYHWTPKISDYNDLSQAYSYQVGFVNDLNTSNPVVRKALTDSHTYWINEVGVDGFRFDAVKHVEPEFWDQFINGSNGVEEVARATGRHDFFTFGEAYNFSAPYRNDGEKIALMSLNHAARPTIKNLLGFPLYNELRRVLNDGGATAYLSYRVNAQMTIYPDPFTVLNFINNHDVERFQKSSNDKSYMQAWAVLLTIPGIPVIYQGDEQNIFAIRQAMFKGGFNASRDHFDQANSMFKYIQALIDLRRRYTVFTRGNYAVVQDNRSGPGILAYTRNHAGDTALVVLNTSDVFSSLVNIPAGTFPPNLQLKLLFTSENNSAKYGKVKTGPRGELLFEASARETLVFSFDKESPSINGEDITWLTVDQQLNGVEIADDTALSGRISKPDTDLLLVINGNLDRAQKFRSDGKGFWRTVLPARGIIDRPEEFSLYVPQWQIASSNQQLSVTAKNGVRTFRQEDPLRDDLGPNHRYRTPLLKSYFRQADIKSVQSRHRGPVLELTIETQNVTNVFGYPNGFDHVAFHIFFDVKKSQGSSQLPLINAQAPQNFHWDIAHHAFSAGNFIYQDKGGSAQNPGNRINLSPIIELDYKKKTITFTYDFSPLGIDDWSGNKIYITTWDRNQDGLKGLKEKPDVNSFGGDPNGPKILDDILLILP